jgi:hypothetical protein
MNVEITAIHKNLIVKEKKDKATGEVYKELILQVEQKIELSDGQFKFESYDIPVDINMQKHYADKKYGDIIKVPCNIYAKAVSADFATLGLSKAK